MSAKAAVKTPRKRQGRVVNIWINSDLRAAMDEACKKNRRPLRYEASIAFETYLESIGLWPKKHS